MDKCLIPQCTNTHVYARGLCQPCYNYAAMLVRTKRTSWRKLEVAGCVKLLHREGRPERKPYIMDWFSKAISDDTNEDFSKRNTYQYKDDKRKIEDIGE